MRQDVAETKPYKIKYEETRKIINCGAQILLPFEVGDAPITFSRWRLAELIDGAIEEALLDH